MAFVKYLLYFTNLTVVVALSPEQMFATRSPFTAVSFKLFRSFLFRLFF